MPGQKGSATPLRPILAHPSDRGQAASGFTLGAVFSPRPGRFCTHRCPGVTYILTEHAMQCLIFVGVNQLSRSVTGENSPMVKKYLGRLPILLRLASTRFWKRSVRAVRAPCTGARIR